MNLQDIMTSRENQEKESKFGSNLKESNAKNIYDSREGDNFENEVNKNDKNNSSNYSYTRSNMIEKEIENNIENKNINKQVKSNYKKDKIKSNRKLYGNDIIDELVEKIKNKQSFNIPREVLRKSLVNWDEELKLGLEQISKIPTKISRNNSFYNSKELENQTFKKSKKYNDVISLLTKNMNMKINNGSNYNNGAYLYYKNIEILKPTIYFNNSRRNNKVYQPIRKNKTNFYLSSIDGKAIIDGERKNPVNNFEMFMQRMGNQKNKNIFFENDNLRLRRSFSTNFYKNDKRFPDFGIRKINYYNKNYFMDEINRINNLLFS